MSRHGWLLLVGLAMANGPAWAADAPGEAACLGMAVLTNDATVIPVLNSVASGKGKVHFIATRDGCPSPDRACTLPAFVMPGDPVIVVGTYGGYACATFTGPLPRTASTTGWLPQDALAETTLPVPGIAAWDGHWRTDGGAGIDIGPAEGGALSIKGRLKRAGSTASGAMAAMVVPQDGPVVFGLDDAGGQLPLDPNSPGDAACTVRLWRLGPYLVAAADARCGGAAAGFTGVYRAMAR